MNSVTVVDARDVDTRDGLPVHTYAEPLSGLRVSWGSVLAGAVAALSISLLLFSLALAVILSVAKPSADAFRDAVVAAGVTSIIATLIGSALGGFFAGYLPGNTNRFIAAVHAFLAWGLAFLVATAFHLSMLGGITRGTTEAAISTVGAAAQTAGATVGGAGGGLDQRAIALLRSLGYSDQEATNMVNQSKSEAQRVLRDPAAQGPVAGGDVRDALNKVKNVAAGATWAYFATWIASALLAILGGLTAAKRLATRPFGDPRIPSRREEPVVSPPSAATPAPV